MTNLATIFQAHTTDVSFRWGIWKVETRRSPAGDDLPVLVSPNRTRWAQYDPSKQAPEAYLRFAELRADLWETEATPDTDALTQSLLDFVVEYGPPYMGSLEGTTDSIVPVDLVLFEAGLLALVLRSYQALEDWDTYQPEVMRVINEGRLHPLLDQYDLSPIQGEGTCRFYDLSSPDEMKLWITHVINSYDDGIRGISPTLEHDPKDGWQPGYTYHSLLNLMWLQLYQVILSRSAVRHCEGCQKLFKAERPDQVYHNVACRGATNARRTYLRNKERKQ